MSRIINITLGGNNMTNKIQFTTDKNIDAYDECGEKKLIIDQYQWMLLEQLFKYSFTEKERTHNPWMIDNLNELSLIHI